MNLPRRIQLSNITDFSFLKQEILEPNSLNVCKIVKAENADWNFNINPKFRHRICLRSMILERCLISNNASHFIFEGLVFELLYLLKLYFCSLFWFETINTFNIAEPIAKQLTGKNHVLVLIA